MADAKIVVKSVDCLGNLTVFDYTTSSGLSISSIAWDFGDGYSSVNIKTNHIYKNAGSFKVRVLANLSNGNKESDSVMVEIVNLPVATFEYMSYSDSCFHNNYICFTDRSKPAITSQNIVKRILIWGDGGSDISGGPKSGDVLCHNYAGTGRFKATMEVTDKFGCKDITSFSYNITGSVSTQIVSDVKYADCKNMSACFYNNSQVQKPATVKYYWIIDSLGVDSNAYFNTPRCVYYSSSKTVKAKLIAVTSSGCKDSTTKIITVDIKPLPVKLVLSDSVMCYGDSKIITVVGPSYTADDIEWAIDSSFYQRSLISGLTFTPKGSRIYPGKHTLSCKIKRGNCTVILKAKFEVKGPVANFEVVNRFQCSTTRQVSMYSQTIFIDTNNAEYFWKIADANGGKCTTEYNIDKNLYSNCNYALGSYHKHIYSKLSSSNKITFIAKDKTTGCVDSTSATVDLLRCTKLFNKTSYKVCQNDMFLLGFNGGTSDPYLFTLDSGKLWRSFPSLIKAPLKGLYNVGFIFRKYTSPWVENIGNDSFRVHKDSLLTFDTIYKSKFLEVLENKIDSITFKDYFRCGDYRVTAFFKNKVFYAGEKIEINWGDLTTTMLNFYATTYLDSIQHRFLTAGVKGNIIIKLFNASGCNTVYSRTVNFGKEILVKFLTPLCLSNKTCMQVNITENSTSNNWTNFNKKRLIWVIDDSVKYTDQFSICHQFRTAGLHRYKIIAIDSLLCTDTLKGSIFIQQVKAGIANAPKVLFCSELRQFFDSSYCLNPLDQINSYHWDFSNVKSTLKNPFISFNSSADSVIVMHTVKTGSGCTDTIRISILLVGGKPYFTIKDTIACGSMNAIFYNKSKNCKSYIWEFGDDLQSTLDMNDTQFVRFNYTKPGRYHIKLKGIDTIYNPSTGNTYYCITEFPGKDSIRDILILPLVKTAIYCRDTICLGDSLLISAKANPDIIADQWDLGDGGSMKKTPPAPFKYLYVAMGNYTIKYDPVVKSNTSGKVCIDSAKKNILVLGVKADFMKDPNSRMPYFTFNNLSQPPDAALNWDFGQPSTGALNTSAEQDPSVISVSKFKQFMVCLQARIPFGCIDSICKPFMDMDSASIILFNVFTPGSMDNKNDCYDILIAGEDVYELLIYDRWGVLVFRGDKDADFLDPDNWNGRLQNTGSECPSGVYYYMFRYRIPVLSNDTKIVNGVIQLIR